MNKVWQLTRSAWKRNGIEAFGMRVVEPHHDGTPHWHLLLFFPADLADKASEIFTKYALQEDGDEPGAALRRLQVETIDPSKGSATGYIAKYISKNIDGYGIDADLYGLEAKDSAQRTEAWASTWGIRQFQQIGGASVTVWRELRRLDDETIDAGLLAELIRAADSAEWDRFTELMGGAVCPRNERPVRPMYLESKTENKYGEIIKKLKACYIKRRKSLHESIRRRCELSRLLIAREIKLAMLLLMLKPPEYKDPIRLGTTARI
ncbi:replication endonuclease [Saccharophagus degradans]|nr:replication endonuclease [Saccharophagus degradans]